MPQRMRAWLGGPPNTSSWLSLDRIFSMISIRSTQLRRSVRIFRAACSQRSRGHSDSQRCPTNRFRSGRSFTIRSAGRYREASRTRIKSEGVCIASSNCPRFIRLRNNAAARA